MTTTSSASEQPRRSGGSDLGSVLKVQVQLWLAVVFMAAAFGAGVLVHAMATPPAASTVPVVGTGSGNPGIFAPPLSEDQLTGELPPGHPEIGEQTGKGDGTKARDQQAESDQAGGDASTGSEGEDGSP